MCEKQLGRSNIHEKIAGAKKNKPTNWFSMCALKPWSNALHFDQNMTWKHGALELITKMATNFEKWQQKYEIPINAK